jgi:hypothetical protein
MTCADPGLPFEWIPVHRGDARERVKPSAGRPRDGKDMTDEDVKEYG